MSLVKLGAVLIVALVFVGSIGRWPWDHDEVHSLVELGHEPINRFPGPGVQVEKMHRLVPVWALTQNAALRIFPANEWGTRVLPSICGMLVVCVAFVAASRAAGAWFGWALGLLLATSQTLIWLSQQNRFYSLALLWLALTWSLIWIRNTRWWIDALVVACALAALLSHNLTLVPLVLMAVSAAAAWIIGSTSWVAARRAIVAASAGVIVYLVYLRPILAGWVSGGTGGTSPIVSFVAQVGIVPVGLAFYGGIWAIGDRKFHAWLILLALSLTFVTLSPAIMGNWNPRYGLFFMVPLWVLAAVGAAAIADALGSRTRSLAWLGAIVLLSLPKLASHFVDGSRHDFRTSAAAVASADPQDAIVSNWPATLQYYLEPMTGQHPTYWAPGEPLPSGQVVVVLASNAWEPVLRVPNRKVDVIAEVGKRRFDEQSYLIRVYRVSAN